jgi:hypothetical protein
MMTNRPEDTSSQKEQVCLKQTIYTLASVDIGQYQNASKAAHTTVP